MDSNVFAPKGSGFRQEAVATRLLTHFLRCDHVAQDAINDPEKSMQLFYATLWNSAFFIARSP